MWRRRDLTEADLVVVDLVAEALVRLGGMLRPGEREGVDEALARAPQSVRDELELLAALAGRLEDKKGKEGEEDTEGKKGGKGDGSWSPMLSGS